MDSSKTQSSLMQNPWVLNTSLGSFRASVSHLKFSVNFGTCPFLGNSYIFPDLQGILDSKRF